MNTNEDKNQSEEPTFEASELLMDSLLKNVAANREGGDDEAFLANVETLLDVNSAPKAISQPGKKSRSKTKRRIPVWVSGGIAAALVVGVSSAVVFFSTVNENADRMIPSLVMESGVSDPSAPFEYGLNESTPTTADQLAQAKQTQEIAKESKDLVIDQIGHESAELNSIQEEISFVEAEMEEARASKKEIDLALRKMFPDSNRTSDGVGLEYGVPVNASVTQTSISGDISIASAAGSGGTITTSGIESDYTLQIGLGGFDDEGKLNSTPDSDGVVKIANTKGAIATASPNNRTRRVQPFKKLLGRSKKLSETDAALPLPAKGPRTLGVDSKIGSGGQFADFAEVPEQTRGRSRSAPNQDGEFGLSRTLIDNPWKSPIGEPLSTFSIDVDTASWTNIRGMLQRGFSMDQIPPDSVRVEEMINYFDWKYPQPDGEHPFGFAVESAQCPWNADSQLLRVAIQGKDVKRDARPASNLVFLLDVSGSMNQSNKLPLLQKSIALMVEEMNENDCVSIVVYAGAEGMALHPTKGNEQAEIMDALKRLKAGGSTNGGAGINLAYKIASQNFIKDGVNRVILCTDGDFNVGLTGTETLTQLVERKAKRDRVFLSVCGFGNDNLNDVMLESITNKGNGTYYFIDTIAEARKVFLKDMMATLVTIAKDVKIQVEFNPGQVKAYRLIGYANRRLAAKDFEDDHVDAGEIGAGHSVTAFYEVVPVSSESNPLRDVTSNLRYQIEAAPEPAPLPKRTVIKSPELALLKLRYKEPDGDVSKLIEKPVMPYGQDWRKSSEDFRFASAVALFGMKLRDNDSVRNVRLPEIIDLAESGIGTDPHGYRAEFIKLLKAAK
ncbi:VWA domain-containing protein [Verrucomicrobiales bacterium]|nr:VWA domain-containing protein [Verrucomicrobiales bacterium]MDC0312003.1 VWA domain-containing protein [bacterium]MDC0322025.1 VWA domain-containing protein [Verrucomicrobiales bacterium]